jgi:hypothetical protein
MGHFSFFEKKIAKYRNFKAGHYLHEPEPLANPQCTNLAVHWTFRGSKRTAGAIYGGKKLSISLN